jgi:hypothetical protein
MVGLSRVRIAARRFSSRAQLAYARAVERAYAATLVGAGEPPYDTSSLHEWLGDMEPSAKICVDVGASDGISTSNTYAYFTRGWAGLAVEPDGWKFKRLALLYESAPSVRLARTFATPATICEILAANGIPRDFAFLSLDIDGYDYFVLSSVLAEYRPRVVMAEINEKIPPPLKFTVNYSSEWNWAGDHFYGQSISQLADLAAANEYDILELHYNNAVLGARELSLGDHLDPADAFNKGYAGKPDRAARFPWNADVDWLLTATPEEATAGIDALFAKYRGQYSLES